MNTKYKLLFLIWLLPNFSHAQYTNVLVSSANNPNETTIAINPKNTNELVGGANLNNVYYSKDGGKTWQWNKLYSNAYGVWGDPCTIIDTAGNYYFFHLSNPPSGFWIDRIVCQKYNKSTNLWNDGTYMGFNGSKAQDKHWAVVDRKTNNIYVSWTQFDKYGSSLNTDSSLILFSKSTDGGSTWSATKRISEKGGDCVDDDNTVEGAVPAVGPNGEIYIAWVGKDGIFFDKSLDKGETWLNKDIFVSDIPGGWTFDIPGINRCNGLPVISCDTSKSVNRGTIYINWSDQRNGTTDTDIWLSKSTDNGITWSKPIRVNDDAAGKQQFFTWMTIDQTNGNIFIVFYDRRNYSDNQTDVYMAVSEDGAKTFKNLKISESPFTPVSNIFFGDYTNIVAHNKIVRPIWTRLENGKLSTWTALIEYPQITDNKTINNDQGMLQLDQNFPNPFNGSTYISFKLRKPSKVELLVVDICGKTIASIIDGKTLQPGKYIETFNLSQCPVKEGIYFYVLKTENQLISRQMIVVK